MRIGYIIVCIGLISCKLKNRLPEPMEHYLVNKSLVQGIIDKENDSIKLYAIGELLKNYGNEKSNWTWYGATSDSVREFENSIRSNLALNIGITSNQLAALYLISAIYFSNLEYCDRIEVLYENKDGVKLSTTNLKMKHREIKGNSSQYGPADFKYKTIDNNVIRDLYDLYELWYLSAKKNGLNNVPSPLSGSRYCWVGSNDVVNSIRE
jgi:hypothetical protein